MRDSSSLCSFPLSSGDSGSVSVLLNLPQLLYKETR